MKVRIVEVRSDEIRSAEVRPTQIGADEERCLEACSSEIRASEAILVPISRTSQTAHFAGNEAQGIWETVH